MNSTNYKKIVNMAYPLLSFDNICNIVKNCYPEIENGIYRLSNNLLSDENNDSIYISDDELYFSDDGELLEDTLIVELNSGGSDSLKTITDVKEIIDDIHLSSNGSDLDKILLEHFNINFEPSELDISAVCNESNVSNSCLNVSNESNDLKHHIDSVHNNCLNDCTFCFNVSKENGQPNQHMTK